MVEKEKQEEKQVKFWKNATTIAIVVIVIISFLFYSYYNNLQSCQDNLSTYQGVNEKLNDCNSKLTLASGQVDSLNSALTTCQVTLQNSCNSIETDYQSLTQ